MKSDKFIQVKLSKNNLDTFFIRSSIFKAINEHCNSFEGDFLDVGCGKMPYREFILQNSEVKKYVGLDIEAPIIYDELIKADFTWNGITMPFDNDTFSSAMATEVLEHCPEPKIVLNEVKRVLKPGSSFFFTVPFLWNLHEVPHDEYRYTPFALERLLKEAGFENIKISAPGGWHAAMAQMLGLWIIRSEMNVNVKRALKILLKPIYKRLLKMDQPPKQFDKSVMITNLVGSATACK